MSKIRTFVVLHFIIFLYSVTGILSKNAALQDFLSVQQILFYGGEIVLLGVYAILWQQILKKLPLNLAFANKAVVIIWGMVWGAILFGETITPRMIIGAAVVLAGVIIVVTGGEKTDE